MKVKVIYEDNTEEILDSVEELGIVGVNRISKDDLRIIKDVGIRFYDGDEVRLKNVVRIVEA
jgi:hypothetical protein